MVLVSASELEMISMANPISRAQAVLGTLHGKGHDSPIPGLPNLGNTCFMNAVVQCVLNTPGRFLEICTAFAHVHPGNLTESGTLGYHFLGLAAAYGNHNGSPILGKDALQALKSCMGSIDMKYAGCQQQDAYEFLGTLLEGLDENLSKLLRETYGVPLPASGMLRSVCGVTTYSTRWCQQCLSVFNVCETTDLALGLPLISAAAQMDASRRLAEESQPVSLLDLIINAQSPEEIEGYDCDRCAEIALKGGTAHKRSTMSQRAGLLKESGDVLVIALYRFLNVMTAFGDFSAVKVRREVSIPTVLSLETGEYRLYGIVSHLGADLNSGHYVAAVRSLRDHQWYDCNDSTVSPLCVRNLYEVSEITATRPGADPFILFYHRFGMDMDTLTCADGCHGGGDARVPRALQECNENDDEDTFETRTLCTEDDDVDMADAPSTYVPLPSVS